MHAIPRSSSKPSLRVDAAWLQLGMLPAWPDSCSSLSSAVPVVLITGSLYGGDAEARTAARTTCCGLQAYELGNFPGIYHLRGGALGWSKSRLPFEGEYNAGGAGRTPNVVSNDDIGEEEREAVDTIRNVQSD